MTSLVRRFDLSKSSPSPALLAYRAAMVAAQRLPTPLVYRAADVGGRLAPRLAPDRARLVARNLERVHGRKLSGDEARAGVQETFASYARYWVDSFRLPTMSLTEIDRDFTYEGYHHILAARAAGVGPIIALPHLGGWEWAAFWMAVIEHQPVAAVVEALEPQDLFEWFVDYRESLGMRVIPLGAGAGSEVSRAIRDREVMCLLSDRDITGDGIEVEFFGERTTLPGGPATLALRTGAPILPTAVYFRRRGCHTVVGAPLPAEREGKLRADVIRITQDLAYRLEELIRRAPEQWHLMSPNWPSDHTI